jgi:ATP-dependent RNA helicase DDX49/DBP8
LPSFVVSGSLKWLSFLSQFLVLDEADRILDVNFEEELRVIFGCLPKKRQTFLFSATMSDNLRSLLELSGNKSYFFEAYEGFKTVETLKQQYIHVPPQGKELHLWHLLSVMKGKTEDPIRSAIVFVSTCKYALLSPYSLAPARVSRIYVLPHNN